MIIKKSNIRVLFNDGHANLPSSSHIPQGGVASFANKFTNYFNKKNSNIELVSLLFSHNTKNNKIYTRETIGNHKYYELIYPRGSLIKSYKKKYTKDNYTKFLEPWLSELNNLFEKIKPDVIYLNGFSLSNWFILETAHRRKIPVCIQHAGIWKKELSTSIGYFSPSIKKIFSSYEKDAHKNASVQIFLNEYSRDTYFSLHNIKKNNNTLRNVKIIPLPIETKGYKKISILVQKHYNIGVVGRWDRIKNHDAILRLAKYLDKNKLPFSINVVTKWSANNPTNYKKEYIKYIKIVDPMSPIKLKTFYKSQDIIFIPSRFDVSPTVLMEAILLGKPVVISKNVGWITDYKKYGLSKLIIDPTASGEIIFKTINSILSNKISYISKFTKIQKKIINKHNINIVFKQYYNIFKQLK